MLWADRLPRLGGIVLLLLSIAIIVSIVASMGVTDNDPFARSDIKAYLQDIAGHNTEVICGLIASIIADSVLGILGAITLFTLFRDRAGALAVGALVLIVAAAASFIVADGLTAAVINIANDFSEGGPAGVTAGSPQILEVGRAMAIAQGVAEQVGWTALSAGFLLFGAIIAWAPAGAVNPPRWLGIFAVIAGIAGFLSWIGIAVDAGFVFFIIGGIAQLIMLIGLGIWLVSRSPEKAAAMRTTTA